MPKNKGAGGNKKRRGKGTAKTTREFVYKTTGEEYGQIIKSLGNGFMEVNCFSSEGTTKMRAHIRGIMRKKVWMTPGDIVLLGIRDYQSNTCDILFKYTTDEARILRSGGALPDNIDISNTDVVSDESYVFENEPSKVDITDL